MLHVVGRALVIVVHGHRLAFNRELIYAARTYRRSRFASQDDLLRQFLIIHLISERTVVESGHFHNGGKVVVYYCIRSIHPLGHRTGRVFTMADVLQETGDLGIAFDPLVRHFVTDTPHYDTRIVAEVMEQVDHIFFSPFVEEQVVTVLTFSHVPFVAGFHQVGSRHVVRRTDRITSHLFQDTDLTADSCVIDSCAQRPQVMVVAYAFEHGLFTIQEEAFTRNDLDRTDTERSRIGIFQFCPVLIQTAFSHIKGGHIRRPECRCMNDKFLVDRTVIILDIRQRHCRLDQLFPVRVHQAGLDSVLLGIGTFRQIDLRIYIHLGKLLADSRSCHECSPNRDMGIFRYDHMYVTVQTGTGIPTGRLGQVFQADSQCILLSRFQILCNIEMEGVISIRPITYFLSVDIHFSMAHSPVEQDSSLLSLSKLRYFKLGTVPSHADKRQTSCTTGMFQRLFLAVLRNSHFLLVVLGAERAVDSPVVRNRHRLPLTVVESGFDKVGVIFAGKLPVFL